MRITVHAEPGDHVNRVAAFAVTVAGLTNQPVQITFNDRTVWARHHDDPLTVADRLLPPRRGTG